MNKNIENSEQNNRERKMDELRMLMRSIPEDDLVAASDKIFDYAANIRKTYPNANDYALYHLVIGSTVEQKPFFDFPGNDSVEKFIKEELVGTK